MKIKNTKDDLIISHLEYIRDRVDQINGHDSDSKFSRAMAFEALNPIFPEKQIILEIAEWFFLDISTSDSK